MTTNWNEIRLNYSLPNQTIFFETAYFGAMSDGTVDIQKSCLEQLQSEGSKQYTQTMTKAAEIRQKMLALAHATRHHAAIVGDVSTPMSHLAHMFFDKKILLLDKDFPSVTAPWVGRRCDIRWMDREGLDYPLEQIETHLKSGVEVFAMSWVMYNSGLKLDLNAIGELCKKHGVIFIVDATQGLGAHALNLDETHVDVLIATCYKWFLAGYGTGIAIASEAFEAKYDFLLGGHGTILEGREDVKDLDNYVYGIRRFELGHVKTQQINALHHALHELDTIGFTNIQARTKSLYNLLIKELAEAGIEVLTPLPRSHNIVMIAGNEARVKKLRTEGVAFTYRHGLIRLAVYFYNNEWDISRLIQALK